MLACHVSHRPLSSSFFYGLYIESLKVIPKRNYLGAVVNSYGLCLESYTVIPKRNYFRGLWVAKHSVLGSGSLDGPFFPLFGVGSGS